jgi:transposase
MAILAELVDLVIGVDTHKDTHTAAVVIAATGAVLEQVTVSATPAGYQQLQELAGRHQGQRIWAIEGTGGYGAGLTRFLQAHAEQVVELDRPKRTARRHGAKSDPLDATRAAREALGRDQLAQPRAAGQRAALQARLTTRRSAVQAATDAQRQLHALVVAAPDALRGRLRGLTTPRLVSACGRLRMRADLDAETAATVASLRAWPAASNSWRSRSPTTPGPSPPWSGAWRPDLLTPCGVGPIVAAIVLCAWSHPGRCRTDAAFAMLGGAAPIPASSGQTVRVRLNRSGDRQLNQALHLIVLTRLRYDPATRAYPNDAGLRARPTARSNAAWSATSPDSSTGSSRPTRAALTQHRSVKRNDIAHRSTRLDQVPSRHTKPVRQRRSEACATMPGCPSTSRGSTAGTTGVAESTVGARS